MIPEDLDTAHLFHGGVPGLSEGDFIEPPDVTGLKYTRREMTEEEGVTTPITQRRDRVYVTSQRDLAKVFAAEWSPDGATRGGGWLYLVTVERDDLEDDPDIPSLGISFACPRACVLKVWQRDVKPNPSLNRMVLDRVLASVGATPIAELMQRRSAD